MFLKEAITGHLVEVMDLHEMMDPHRRDLTGRYHYGEDLPDPEAFSKSALVFPSGEPLPRCWRDPHYRDHQRPR